MREFEIIKTIVSQFPRSPHQWNRPFHCDAELFDVDGARLGITIDEYSESEDHFSSFFPERLGHNLVAATLSDLLASGSEPLFFLHSMSLPRGQEESFATSLSTGLSKALAAAQCFLLGGDLGVADAWRYVGVGIGRRRREIFRSGAKVGQVIYSSGPFGAGNRQALLLLLIKEGRIPASSDFRDLASPTFPIRAEQARLAWKYARFMMDSSDGFLPTMKLFRELSHDCRFVVEGDASLIEGPSVHLARQLNIPPAAFLLSSAGEYELVFGLDASDESAFLGEARALGLTFLRVGHTEEGDGLSMLQGSTQTEIPEDCFPDPRFHPPAEYLKMICEQAARIWKVS